MRCTADDVQTAITELRTGQALTGTHHETSRCGPSRPTRSRRPRATTSRSGPRTTTRCPGSCGTRRCASARRSPSYQLAKRLGAKRVLVVTFKPAVEDAWETDLRVARRLRRLAVPVEGERRRPDEGRQEATARLLRLVPGPARQDRTGSIKAKNEWLHWVNWDLVIFDEYHFGAWRDNAKELFEGEDDDVAKKELAAEYAAVLDDVRRRTRGAVRRRGGLPADHHTGVPLPVRYAVQGAGDRRVHRGADLQLDLHRRAARQAAVRRRASRRRGTRTRRCRRCGCSPTRCPTS